MINLGKLPASCSGIHQPCDVSPVFRSAKAALKKVYANGMTTYNFVLDHNIRAALAALKADSNISLTSSTVTDIVFGCMDIVFAVRESCTSAKIKAGFSDCGQYPLDFDKLMRRSYVEVSDEMLDHLKLNIDRDVGIFLQNGFLSERDLDASQIPTNSDSLRDELPIQNQRAVLVTNVGVRSRHVSRQNSGLDIGNTIVDCPDSATRSQLKKASSMIGKIHASEIRKEAERSRKATQSVEESKIEKERKKEDKRRKDEKRQAEIMDAKLMLFKL